MAVAAPPGRSGGAFPADAWAAFTVLRLAEDLRCGGLSRWSEPEPLETLFAELSGLREGLGRALASEDASIGVTAAVLPGDKDTPAVEIPWLNNVPVDDSLHALAARAGNNFRELQPALRSLADSPCRNRRGRLDCSLPRWCAASSGHGAAGDSEERTSSSAAAAWTGEGDVGVAVMAYCSALKDCLAVQSPVSLTRPHRRFDAMLPPHIRETTTTINSLVLRLRDALLACADAVAAAKPSPGDGRRPSSRPCTPLRGSRSMRDGSAEAVAAASEIRGLLGRLAVQAEASDLRAVRTRSWVATVDAASEAVGSLLQRCLGVSCGEPPTPLRAWFSSADAAGEEIQCSRVETQTHPDTELDENVCASSSEGTGCARKLSKRVAPGEELVHVYTLDLVGDASDVVGGPFGMQIGVLESEPKSPQSPQRPQATEPESFVGHILHDALGGASFVDTHRVMKQDPSTTFLLAAPDTCKQQQVCASSLDDDKMPSVGQLCTPYMPHETDRAEDDLEHEHEPEVEPGAAMEKPRMHQGLARRGNSASSCCFPWPWRT